MESRSLKIVHEMLAEHENLLSQHQQQLEEKVDYKTMDSLLASKISNKEINDLLPDMNMYQEKFSSQLEEGLEGLTERLEEKFIVQDARMNKIRNEFDMTTLNSFISTKADQNTVNTSFQSQEIKIATLDKNIVAIATDFETF